MSDPISEIDTFQASASTSLTAIQKIEAFVVIALILCFGIVGLLYLPRAISAEENPRTDWIAWRTALQDELTEVLPHGTMAKSAFGYVEYDLLGQGSEGVFIGTDKTLFTNQDLPAFEKDALEIEANLLTFISEAQNKVEAAGSDLVLVLLPDKRRIIKESFPHAVPSWVADRYDRLLTSLGEAGLEVVPARESLSILGAEAFLKNDTHWSVPGADAVAQQTGKRIRVLYPELVDTNPYERDDEDLEVLDWEGDMRTFIPLHEARLGQEFPAEDIARPYISPLEFRDEIPEITLVGTSYTGFRNLEVDDPWLFSDFLRHAIGADIYLCSDWGEDVERPFQDYWSKVEQGHLPTPSLVIWEVPERYFGYQVPEAEIEASGSLFESPDDLTCD